MTEGEAEREREQMRILLQLDNTEGADRDAVKRERGDVFKASSLARKRLFFYDVGYDLT